MERFTEKFKDGRNIIRKGINSVFHVGFGSFYDGDAVDKLAEYEDLEESGRLVKLPCKVGTTVYSLECGEIEPYVVTSFQNDGEDLWFLNRLGGFIGRYGKTVFLTKEEAQAALKKM